MADLTITAANVSKTSGTQITGTSGATITAGDVLYEDSSDSNKLKLADVTTSSTTATVKGIALNDAASGQPVTYQTSGIIDVGATLTVGEIYVLSASGSISPEGDLLTNDYLSVIGFGTATDGLTLAINNTGVQIP